MKLDDYMTAPDAAQEIGIRHSALLKRLVRGDSIEHERLGRMYLIPKAEVQRLKAERERSQ